MLNIGHLLTISIHKFIDHALIIFGQNFYEIWDLFAKWSCLWIQLRVIFYSKPSIRPWFNALPSFSPSFAEQHPIWVLLLYCNPSLTYWLWVTNKLKWCYRYLFSRALWLWMCQHSIDKYSFLTLLRVDYRSTNLSNSGKSHQREQGHLIPYRGSCWLSCP